jgi:hypothetical protein
MLVEYFKKELNRLFHTDRDEEAAKTDGSLTQYPSGVRKPQQNHYEIGGLRLSLVATAVSVA